MIVVTDQDALAVIAKDDEIVNDLAAAFDALSDEKKTAGLARITAWNSDRNAYAAWADSAQKDLQGGFIMGAWFGVPDLYNAAITWGERLKGHAVDVRALGGDVGALPDLPKVSKPADLGDVSAITTELVIGLGLVAVIVLARK